MNRPIAAILISATLALGACSSSATDTAADTTAAAEPAAQSVSSSDTTMSGDVAQTDPVVETTAAAEPPKSAASAASAPSTVAAAPSAPSTVATAKAVTDVAVQPGLSGDKFVGAASDVKTTSCKRSGDHWAAGGTVTNKSGKDAGYRIYVAFNRVGSTDTRALVQTDVAVPNGKSQAWEAVAAVTDEALTCILRVERTAKA